MSTTPNPYASDLAGRDPLDALREPTRLITPHREIDLVEELAKIRQGIAGVAIFPRGNEHGGGDSEAGQGKAIQDRNERRQMRSAIARVVPIEPLKR